MQVPTADIRHGILRRGFFLSLKANIKLQQYAFMPPRTPSTLSNNAAKWLDKSTKIIDAATKALQKYSGAPQSLETPVVRRRHSLGPIGDALRDAGAVTISSRHELARGLVTNPELCGTLGVP